MLPHYLHMVAYLASLIYIYIYIYLSLSLSLSLCTRACACAHTHTLGQVTLVITFINITLLNNIQLFPISNRKLFHV